MDDVEAMAKCEDYLIALQSKSLLMSLEEAFNELEEWKVGEWERQRVLSLQDRMDVDDVPGCVAQAVNTSSFLRPSILPPRVLVLYLLAAVLHLLCGLSIKHSIFLMTSLKALVLSSDDMDFQRSAQFSHRTEMPRDVRGVLKVLDLEPNADHFICCPSCFTLYPLNQQNEVQARCTYRPVADAAVCGAGLWTTRRVKGQRRQYPCRKFVRQDFRHWLGKLLCRPGMEQIMDKPVRESSSSRDGAATDIWDAPVLHTIRLRNGQPFLDPETDEGRYVFSICIDGFNPRGKGGPPVSVGSIFFACLNLPPHLRYRSENMYLAGVIPGPKHPSKEEMNHILGPILEPFLEVYENGVFYTETQSYPRGKKCHVAVLPLVADTVAAHQMNGNAPHTHTHFCPFCMITLSDMNNLEYTQWPRRTCQEHIAIARAWLFAKSIDHRTALYDSYGIRWSSMLTLPYWDPIKHMAIDPMHNLYLGVLKHHCEKVWGMDSEIGDGLDGITNDPAKHKPTTREMKEAHDAIRYGKYDVFDSLRTDVVRQLAKELGVLRWKSKKHKVVKRLQELRIEKGWFTEDGHGAMQDPRARNEGGAELSSVANVMRDIAASETTRDMLANSYERNILATACVALLGGAPDDYRQSRKRALLDMIEKYRTEHGISTRVVQRGKTRLRRSDISDDVYQKGLDILKTGTKTELGKLLQPVLAELCSRELRLPEAEIKSHHKEQLLAKLHEYRFAEGLTDETGKLLPEHISGQVDDAAVSEEDLVFAEDKVNHGSRSSLLKIRPSILAVLCCSKLNIKVRATRTAVMDALDEYRRQEGITDDNGRVVADRRGLRNRILGKVTLKRIWADMKTLQAPTSLTKAPPTVGTPGEGSLGADEWRTFCTVNLPVTLIAMWGLKPAQSRERALLDNFMDLVAAVTLASKRVTDKQRRADYQLHMHRYLTDLLTLFTGTEIVSNQHKALHLPEVLEFLGPAHVLWCYGFERGNYELQQINTNNRAHELPETMLKHFCYKQNLRHLMESAVLPPIFRDLMTDFQLSFGRDQRGTLLNDMSEAEVEDVLETIAFEESSIFVGRNDRLDLDVEQALQARLSSQNPLWDEERFSPFVRQLPSITEATEVYKTHRTSPGDSNVVFLLDGEDQWRAGIVRDIFERIERVDNGEFKAQIYIAIDEYLQVNDSLAVVDPYRRYPFGGGQLFQAKLATQPLVVTAKNILCHFTLTRPVVDGLDTELDYIHVMPQNKW